MVVKYEVSFKKQNMSRLFSLRLLNEIWRPALQPDGCNLYIRLALRLQAACGWLFLGRPNAVPVSGLIFVEKWSHI
eukprot:scaffold337840_cov20-Prasinocladus_malaysianus.AAC.1